MLDRFDRLTSLHPWIGNALGVLATLVGALIAWLLVVRWARRAHRHFEALLALAQESLDASSEIAAAQRLTALRLVVNAAKYVLVVAALLLVLGQLIKLDSLLLPAGFLGAALGLGAQNLVRDVVAGLFIVFEGQFAVGDVVKINNVLGTVEEVGLRVTRLRDEAGQMHFFPNGAITTVAKYPNREVALQLLVPLADTTQREAAAAVVLEAVQSFNMRYGVLTEKVEIIAAEENEEAMPNSWLEFRLLVHPERVSSAREKLPARVTSALQAANIPIEAGADVEIITPV